MSPNHDFDAQTYSIIGAAQEVHRVLGCGFLERVYQLALANELRRRGVPHEVEVPLPVSYKGDVLDCPYRIDVLCFGEVLVELKALGKTGGPEDAQVLNYLKASSMDTALLLNFGGERLEVRRFTTREQEAPSVSSVTSVDN